jgi:hypothetical protein
MRTAARFAAVTGLAMVASLLCALAIKRLAGLQGDVSVLAVAISATSVRVLRTRAHSARLLAVAVLPVGAVIGSRIGNLMLHHVVVGDTLFVAGITAGIWLRRFGPPAAAAGGLLSVPLVAILVVPAPIGGGAAHDAWSALIAGIAGTWALIALTLAQRSGFLAAAAPATTPARHPPVAGRLPASTRMAIQMGLGLGVAFLLGHRLWPNHWTWIVLTAYVVASGNRGRADVIHKSGLRIGGAAVGTLLATFLIRALPAGDDLAIVIIMITLVLGTWLRQAGYAYWAAAVTAVVALLNGYYGQRDSALLLTRLEEIVCGGAIATAIALTVLPIRTTDVLRRRVADALAALTDYLTAARRRDLEALLHEHRRVLRALASLDEIAPPLRLAHRFSRNPEQHPARALLALGACGPPLERLTARATDSPELLRDEVFAAAVVEFQEAVVATRRSMARAAAPPAPQADRETRPPLPVTRIALLADAIEQLSHHDINTTNLV